ncbi:MAG: hypothetical protein KAU38_09335 [Desulfobacterales bacterium]|nr:hypothetical protein [Desulfobacterales bacterium]
MAMGETVTIRVSERVSRSASYLAAQTDRRMEQVLAEWLDQAAVELPVEFLPDLEVLALRDLQMVPTEQTELSSLLSENREGSLDDQGRARLDKLMKIYRRGLVRKARALKVAVQRGLIPPLNRET